MSTPANRRIHALSTHLGSPTHPSTSSPSPSAPPLTHAPPPLPNDPSPLITPADLASYRNNGYFVVRGLVPHDALAHYRRRFVDIAEQRGVAAPDTMIVMREVAVARGDGGRKGEAAIAKDDAVLSEYLSRPEILRYVSGLIGPDVMAVHSMVINKPPNVGDSGRHPMHQDLYYFPFRPADAIVCAWTAMEPVNRANGCLSMIPGSHRRELLPHGYPAWESGVNAAYHGILDIDLSAERRVHVEMQPGDTVFFHPLLVHGSGANRSQGYRKAISCHFASSHCEYIDVTGTHQEEIAREIGMLATAKGVYGPGEISFQQFWHAKSRLVMGRAGTM
ncbi:hypothetical protein DFJ73DRAFT_960733 [Zopfochytrium polystomum]|nr:hypothetical protein DFJ73DRAFT_960733 [Zopfochytrium polystomum]